MTESVSTATVVDGRRRLARSGAVRGVILLVLLGAWWIVWAATPEAVSVPAAEKQALQNAEAAYFQHDYAAAVDSLRAFIEQYPESDLLNQAYLRLGQAYSQLDEDEAARQAFSKAVALKPDDPLAMQAVSYWGNLYVRRYLYVEAATMCEILMRRYPNTRAAEMAHYLLGNYYYAANEIDKAIQAYRSFLESFPDSLYFRSAFRQLVSLLLLADRAREAEEILDRFLTSSPGDSQLIEQLAEVYRRQKRYEDAIRLLRGALSKRPEDAALWEALGEAYADQGDRTAAVRVWQQLPERRGATYATYQQLGMLYRRYEYFDEAAEAFRQAIARQPGYSYLYTQLAEVYTIQGKREEALRVFLKGLQRVGLAYANRVALLNALETLYPPDQRAQRLHQAAGRLRRQLGAEAQSNPKALATLAELELLARRVGEAMRELERLAQVQPDQGRLLVQYAERFRGQREYRIAEQLYRGAIRLFPDAPDVPLWWMALGEMAEATERWDQAYAAYRQAEALDRSGRLLGEIKPRLAALLLDHLNRPGEAAELVRSLMEDPAQSARRPQWQLVAARVWLRLGEYARAQDALQQAASPQPDERAEILFLRGELAFFQGRWEEALEQYRRVAQDYPTAPSANEAIARIALIQGHQDNPQALEAYVRFVESARRGAQAEAVRRGQELLDRFGSLPLAVPVRLQLAELFQEQGQTEMAVSLLEEVASSEDAAAPQALLRLGALYAAQGATDQALDAYQRLLDRWPNGIYALQAQQAARALLEDSPGGGS